MGTGGFLNSFSVLTKISRHVVEIKQFHVPKCHVIAQKVKRFYKEEPFSYQIGRNKIK